MKSTIATARSKRRRRIRQLAPGLAESHVVAIACEDNPVVRIGLLMDAIDRAYLPMELANQARRDLVDHAGSVVDEAVGLLRDPGSRRGRAAAIGLLGLRRGREFADGAAEDGYVSPDDRGYRPAQRDGLLHGPGRATGAAARAVRRRTTYAKWQLRG